MILDVLGRENSHDTWELFGLIGVDAFDQAVGHGTAKNTDMQDVFFFHIVNINAFATQKPKILDPLLRSTHIFTLTISRF